MCIVFELVHIKMKNFTDDGIPRHHNENIIVRKCNGWECKARRKFLSDIGEPAHYEAARKGIIFISPAERGKRAREKSRRVSVPNK